MITYAFDHYSLDELVKLKGEIDNHIRRATDLNHRVESILNKFDFQTCAAMIKHFNWTQDYKGPLLTALRSEAKDCLETAIKAKEAKIEYYNHRFMVTKDRDCLSLKFVPVVYNSFHTDWDTPMTEV